MSSSNGSSDNDAGTSGTTTSSLTDRINEDITMCNRMQEHPTDNSVPRSENVIAENFSGGVDGSSESGVTPSPSGEVGDVVAPERSSSNSSSPLFFTDDDNSSADDTISTIRSTRDLDDDDDDEDDDDEDDNDDDEEDGSNENEDYGHGERVPQAEDAWLRDLTHSPRLSNSQSSSDSSLDRASMKCFIPYKEESKPKPRHKWFVVPEVMKRELGTSSRLHASELFQKRCYGSLHVVQRLELMYKLEAHKGCVNALNFNPSGTILASASDDRKVMLWDWALGKCMLQYESGHTSNVLQARFLGLSGDRHIVSSARDGQVRLAVLSGTGVCKSTRQLFRHKRPVSRLATLSDTPHVFHSAGEDGLVTTIDVRESRAKKFLVVRDEVVGRIPLFCIDNNPMNCHEFCVAGDDKYIRLYDKRMIAGNKVPLKKFCPNHLVGRYVAVNVTCAIFNYNGKEILGSYNDEDIYLFDTELSDGSDYVHRYRGHRNHVTVKGVNFFGPKSQFIVSGSDCGHIYFWEKNTESIVQWMAGDEEGIVS
ncbi:DDB1- and CUL4-associated factor 8 [Nilaparvata lugens]|uniref:DDB1- and CUL4-associated factor 8 n=1 Tax=Nilaparvata lugens TaxID=108931 RepID=UPI00193E2BCA|nr:DDB1- and CUL4-associated factor 8 [Nilaparvata lugens]